MFENRELLLAHIMRNSGVGVEHTLSVLLASNSTRGGGVEQAFGWSDCQKLRLLKARHGGGDSADYGDGKDTGDGDSRAGLSDWLQLLPK